MENNYTTASRDHKLIRGQIMPGHGVASGTGKDERYPEGTLKLQVKYFLEQGLDLSNYYMGTINLDISPCSYQIKKPKHFLKDINWSDYIPPENFYFFDVTFYHGDKAYDGLVYMPDPKTKEDHIQKPNILELILLKIERLAYGVTVEVAFKNDQLDINCS